MRMSVQTSRRILECVPPLLGKEEQFRILAFYIPSILQQQKERLKYVRFKVSELYEAYSAIINGIKDQEYKLDWFVSKVFSEQEIQEFLDVFKYTMVDSLARSYSSIREDLALF